MEIAALKEKLESTETFKEFKEEHPNAYFAHLFSMHAPNTPQEPQLGYCIGEEIVVFEIEPIKRRDPDKAMAKERIKELDLSSVKLTPEEAEGRALEKLKADFPGEMPTKTILLLQHLDAVIYNITLVTSTFNIMNVWIDATDGKVLKAELKPIMSLGKQA